MNIKQFCEQLEAKIQQSYEEQISIEDAEKLAAEFLHALITISKELSAKDLDSRLRKSGVKAVRAAIYLDILQKSDGKKPTEAAMAAQIESDSIVAQEQNALDQAEVERDELERYYDIFNNCHIYFRGIAKGNFGG